MAEKKINVGEGSGDKTVKKKTVLILAAVFLIEAVAITAVFLLAGAPPHVKAQGDSNLVAVGDMPVEVLVVQDKFPNTLTGRTYLYDTEIYIKVLKKHRDEIGEKLKNMSAQIQSDIAEIFRAAEPTQLHETSLATLKRRIRAKMDQRLGRDAEDLEYVQNVVIPRCTQFRADF